MTILDPDTLKVVQNFTTQFLNVFVGNSIFSTGPLHLRHEVLTFIAQCCSDRVSKYYSLVQLSFLNKYQAASLRLVDLNSIWSLLSKSLLPSSVHDETTSTPTFHKIVSILGALIRLRRDLVMPHLPHLGMVLRQLMMSIRNCRPQLGAKQSTLVANTLPIWVNVKQPLGPEEAKAFARLLEALATKTTIRSHSSLNTDAPKAESLAKPFSKHAAFVLEAYIDAMNDPLCSLPAELRKQLSPGLFALCGMMNEHSRDAMMVSALDAGGKTTMKAIWKEYEKQKYVGKG